MKRTCTYIHCVYFAARGACQPSVLVATVWIYIIYMLLFMLTRMPHNTRLMCTAFKNQFAFKRWSLRRYLTCDEVLSNLLVCISHVIFKNWDFYIQLCSVNYVHERNWRKKLFINNISLILSDICKFILNTFLSLERTNKIIKIKYLLSCKFSDI